MNPSMNKLSFCSRMVLALAGLIVFATASGQNGQAVNFGSPEAVENRIAEDRRDRNLP